LTWWAPESKDPCIVIRRAAHVQHPPVERPYHPAAHCCFTVCGLRRYIRNSDSRIEIVDGTHARHWSTWIVVMKTNVNIHISAIGRYEDLLEKRDERWLITSRKRIE
jgi:hypothetical protein